LTGTRGWSSPPVRAWLTTPGSGGFARRAIRRSAAAVSDTLRASGVTRREADILSLLGAGLTNADIAEQLYLSVRTVESRVSSLLAKLGARNRTDLAARHLELQRREGR
jgi:DNA-binding NarL/FixJ family response regulator